jgi:hypothetical protein
MGYLLRKATNEANLPVMKKWSWKAGIRYVSSLAVTNQVVSLKSQKENGPDKREKKMNLTAPPK